MKEEKEMEGKGERKMRMGKNSKQGRNKEVRWTRTKGGSGEKEGGSGKDGGNDTGQKRG